jgi:hypothetical protein
MITTLNFTGSLWILHIGHKTINSPKDPAPHLISSIFTMEISGEARGFHI